MLKTFLFFRGGKDARMDIDGDNRELLQVLLHANVPIPTELTTPVMGYNTIQNRNAQLRNLLLKHQALLDDADIANNPELTRSKALKAARQKFEQAQEKREMEALQKGDLREITKTYGVKHKKIQQIKKIMREQDKEEKRLETGRKHRERHKQNISSLRLIKKNRKKMASSLALADIAQRYKKDKAEKPKKGHSRKRSSSIGANKNVLKDRRKKLKPSKARQDRPFSARGRSSTAVSLAFNVGDKGKKERKSKKKKKKKVSFAEKKGKVRKKITKKKKLHKIDDKIASPVVGVLDSRKKNVSDGPVVVSHNGWTPKTKSVESDGLSATSFELEAPMNTMAIGDEDDILVGIERMHSQNVDSMVIHSRINSALAKEHLGDSHSSHSLSFDEDESSEITFSDDGEDEDDDNGDDANAVPLSVLRLRALEKEQEKEKEKKSNKEPQPQLRFMQTIESQTTLSVPQFDD